MSVNREYGNWVRLGDYIEEVVLRLEDNIHIQISGINLEQGFIPTVANMTGVDKSKYKLVPTDSFACNLMHIGRDVKIPIAYNDSKKSIAVSPAYYIFKIKNDKKNSLLGYYLEMLLTRNEFGRLTWFHTDSSIRGNLLTSELCDIMIPLPNTDIQQELVNTYNGLKALAEENEALIKPLSDACQAYIVDCKKKYPNVQLGEYIESTDNRNFDLHYDMNDVVGMTITKQIIPTKADVKNTDLAKFLIVMSREFVYNPRTHGKKIGLGFNNNNKNVMISWNNISFKVQDSKLDKFVMPEYLYLLFCREEWDREACFRSLGSSTEVFSWIEMCRMEVPLPPINVQQAIVNIYNCAEEAKNIATEAREKMKTLCPALVQRAING
ncbi:Type I restriction-modification system, specificity subunit S [Mucinivorans hirudinis]|uniref:Type I restriction-modification system, specificity subunit S n=1 Tax=Mucinivorans hirudinis TaxID=1433126 RepID=A0A060RAT2_9BACT|nr:Type I restriction-modification system, specificity subunit S [Mucinivorans hirudinis]